MIACHFTLRATAELAPRPLAEIMGERESRRDAVCVRGGAQGEKKIKESDKRETRRGGQRSQKVGG